MNTEDRLEQLELRVAWMDETVDALDKTVAQLNKIIQLQQDELRYLYQKIKEQQQNGLDVPDHEKPPHY